MTKVQNNLFNLAVKNNRLLLAVKIALCSNVEANGSVYLPNAYNQLSGVITSHQFSGFLSVLKNNGFYQPCQESKYFGYIQH